jgi:hypothetical protein
VQRSKDRFSIINISVIHFAHAIMAKVVSIIILSLLYIGAFAVPAPQNEPHITASGFDWQAWRTCSQNAKDTIFKAWEESKLFADTLVSWNPMEDIWERYGDLQKRDPDSEPVTEGIPQSTPISIGPSPDPTPQSTPGSTPQPTPQSVPISIPISGGGSPEPTPQPTPDPVTEDEDDDEPVTDPVTDPVTEDITDAITEAAPEATSIS